MFSQVEVQKFEAWMLAHLRKFFPERCEALGETQLRETIQFGIKRAAAYGITLKRDVCKYLDLVIVLGRNFDEDRTLPWAGKILNGRDRPTKRIQCLQDTARTYLNGLKKPS